ncbi:hypothetical protein B296_00007691 [Ensete ventricosum]|uniref:Uncharacterized protein n=1 Tax=Ensete ventricosum TaxID=4639 RepID=A0A427AU16_ENSVE|nr:hypothetical protein B296_00007691 [Ensete ventricosum]
MLNICVDTARQQRQHRRKCKMMKGSPYTCISVDNDAGKDGATLHLHWHRCRSRAALMQLLSDTDVDAEHLQLRRHLSSHRRFPSLSIIATRDPAMSWRRAGSAAGAKRSRSAPSEPEVAVPVISIPPAGEHYYRAWAVKIVTSSAHHGCDGKFQG